MASELAMRIAKRLCAGRKIYVFGEPDRGWSDESEVAVMVDEVMGRDHSTDVADLAAALRECDQELKDIVSWHGEEVTPLRDIELRHIKEVREHAATVLSKLEGSGT